MNHKDAGDGE